MISKRSFLRGSGGLLGGTLLSKYFHNFESFGKGLIESPKDFKNTLFIDPKEGWFELGTWDITEWDNPEIVRHRRHNTGHLGWKGYDLNDVKDELPTWFEYLEIVWEECVDPNCPEETERIYNEYGLKPHNYEQQIEARIWFDEFKHSSEVFRSFAPPWRAYDYLMNLDLGPELHYPEFSMDGDGLFFIEYEKVSHDLNAVLPLSSATLPLLQKRLIELGEPTRIVTNHDNKPSIFALYVIRESWAFKSLK